MGIIWNYHEAPDTGALTPDELPVLEVTNPSIPLPSDCEVPTRTGTWLLHVLVVLLVQKKVVGVRQLLRRDWQAETSSLEHV